MEPILFETRPALYRHLQLEIDGTCARIALKVDESKGLRPGYLLKLNSYDLSVDIELADAVTRLRFEHPEVKVVILTSATEGTFCAGANIFMLARSDHAFKVNFCKFTNETRLAMEEASRHSGQRYLAAINGIASGGGYELALACEHIMLVDDRRSAVSLPEIPYLGVLPGTGGLTRLIDKRHVRKDLADIFVTLAEGVRGEKALRWGLVDEVCPRSSFASAVEQRARAMAEGVTRKVSTGVALAPLEPIVEADAIEYRHVRLSFDSNKRLAELTLRGPDPASASRDPHEAGCDWYPLRMCREVDDALLRLRFNYPEIGLILLKSQGEAEPLRRLDSLLFERRGDWLVNETILLLGRVLKRLEVSARSCFAIVEQGSCFHGFLLEFVLAADRSYMQSAAEKLAVSVGHLSAGLLPMANGLSRLQTRFLAQPERAAQLSKPALYGAEQALEAGLVTAAPDELDWEEEIRLAVDERLAMSPDALTGMEASLRWGGPETMESKIFGRLSAWQNWIFQRPNAVGEKGALKLYGQGESPSFDWRRT